MGKSYTATIDATAWKQHTCVNCSGIYAYRMSRKVTGQSGNEQQAEANARNNVMPTLQREVDQHPCPGCGTLQPDMVGQSKAGKVMPLLIVAVVAFAVLLILRASYAVQANSLTMVGAVLALIVGGLFALIAMNNPNKDLQANRQVAAKSLSTGIMRQTGNVPPMGTSRQMSPASGSSMAFVVLGGVLLGAVLVALPEIMRASAGWPINEESYPPVAGPGDITRIYMDRKISSVKGYWRGWPVATLKPAKGEPVEIEGRTNAKGWGDSISAKSSEKSSSSTPWVEVPLPDDPALAGQTIQCELNMRVLYPKAVGSSSFDEVEETLTRTVELKLAPVGAGKKYSSYWWMGTAGGFGLILFCGVVLWISAKSLGKKARPAQLFAA